MSKNLRAVWSKLVPFLGHHTVEEELRKLVDDQWWIVKEQIDGCLPLFENEIKDISLMEKPWTKYPLYTFSMAFFDVNTIRTYNILEMKAKKPTDLEWWVWEGCCWWINGKVLLPLLRLAFPEKTFKYFHCNRHGWVQDNEGNRYDLSQLDETLINVSLATDDVKVYDNNPFDYGDLPM